MYKKVICIFPNVPPRVGYFFSSQYKLQNGIKMVEDILEINQQSSDSEFLSQYNQMSSSKTLRGLGYFQH